MTSHRVELAVSVPTSELPLAEAALRAQAERVLVRAELPGRLSLVVVDDATMQRVNRDFHACDEPTDVLAFSLADDDLVGQRDPDAFAYEVVVSLDTARREAQARGVAPAAELLLYVTHGLLHLAGEDDHDPEAAVRMHARTLEILAELGHVNSIEAADSAPGPDA